jgi:hypothetical protein
MAYKLFWRRAISFIENSEGSKTSPREGRSDGLMRPLLCPSPKILDQNFPRSADELADMSIALANIHDDLINGKFGLVIPDTFVLFIETFDWNRTGAIPLFRDMYRILENWLLKYQAEVVRPNLPKGTGAQHPLPCGCEQSNEANLWAEEVERLLIAHDEVCGSGAYFIGVACDRAFAGEEIGTYCPEPNARHFPLVGPAQLNQLQSYWLFDIPGDLHQQKVTFNQAHNHVHLIGGVVQKPNSGSHYRVTFPNGIRPWILDYNDDPQEDSRISQIVPLTGLDFDYIKFVLLRGTKPKMIGRFDDKY